VLHLTVSELNTPRMSLSFLLQKHLSASLDRGKHLLGELLQQLTAQ
jgi:hypothetical protein